MSSQDGNITMSKPKSRRIPHPIWFGVAAVLMVTLWVVLAVWLPYHKEQVVVRELEEMGGVVFTYWSGPEWIEFGPEWLSIRTYDGSLSWFDRVNGVGLSKTAITDEGLKHLSVLINIDTLNLENTQISDAGLKHLSDLTNLDQLLLGNNTQVTDEGIKELQRALPNCRISRTSFFD
jgi:Leucine-rich repeat (LRR) protein